MGNQKNKYCRSMKTPDEKREFKSHGHFDVFNFIDSPTIGRGVFEPGWKWSADVKPIAKTESCEASHTGVCLSGEMTVKMDSGDEFTLKSGDVFRIPPGHDAWVNGKEPCILLDIGSTKVYAQKAA